MKLADCVNVEAESTEPTLVIDSKLEQWREARLAKLRAEVARQTERAAKRVAALAAQEAQRQTLLSPPAALACIECRLAFADAESLEAHRQSALAQCFSESTMLSLGWAKRSGVWMNYIPTPRGKPKAAQQLTAEQRDEAWTCVLCQKSFAAVEGFQLHQLLLSTPLARCLAPAELTALDLARSAAGLWRLTPFSQTRRNQVLRLASVRAQIEDFERAEGRAFDDAPDDAPADEIFPCAGDDGVDGSIHDSIPAEPDHPAL